MSGGKGRSRGRRSGGTSGRERGFEGREAQRSVRDREATREGEGKDAQQGEGESEGETHRLHERRGHLRRPKDCTSPWVRGGRGYEGQPRGRGEGGDCTIITTLPVHRELAPITAAYTRAITITGGQH